MKRIKEKQKVKNLEENIVSRIETIHRDNLMIKSIENTYGITAFKNFFDQGFHFAKNNFSVFSALFTAAVIVLTGAFAALDVAYKRSGLSVHHINSIYIETGVKVSVD